MIIGSVDGGGQAACSRGGERGGGFVRERTRQECKKSARPGYREARRRGRKRKQ